MLSVFSLASGVARGVPFVTSYTDGESWNSIYAQGFSPFVRPSPDPGLDLLDLVSLDRFEFFKSGNADITDSFQLAVVDNYFVNLDGFTVDHPNLIALSTNTIDGTAQFAVGDPIGFQFQNAELTYAIDYAAIYVTNDGGNLTPIQVPSMIADYVETEPGSGVYVPESDYGDPDTEFQYSASNFVTTDEFGSFLRTFDPPYADASFVAYFDLEPVLGDYNGDGAVNTADYTVWRDSLGGDAATAFAANSRDPLNSGVINLDDYAFWKDNFAGTIAAITSSAAVPEPGSSTLVSVLGLICWTTQRLRRAQD